MVKYLKGWLPAGVTGAAAIPIFFIEVISQFVRIISLSVRLFANILAGHLLILFMGGGLAVLLGRHRARLDHAADRGRLLHLRGRPGGDPAGIHLRDSHIHLLRRGKRRRALRKEPWIDLHSIAAAKTTGRRPQVVALGVGAGLGTIGPGIGVGYIFGKVIESVTRQPEMREEITSIQWLGFALTEAIVFYAFIFGLIAFFL